MLLGELVGCIELLQERIRSHRDALRENETRTRMALIDPLLRALGWDVFDPGMVKPEYKVEGGWADYALLRSDGRPAATVEAKKLGEALSSHRMQMLNYANASGIEYVGLTDGNHWELYNWRGRSGHRGDPDGSRAASRCAGRGVSAAGASAAGGAGGLRGEREAHATAGESELQYLTVSCLRSVTLPTWDRIGDEKDRWNNPPVRPPRSDTGASSGSSGRPWGLAACGR